MTTFPNPSPISLIDISTYLPEKRVSADYYAQFASTDDLRGSSMFRVPKFRHHAAKDETNTDMVERAATGLLARHGRSVLAGVDILLTHSQKPDAFFHGAGGGIAHRLGITPRIVLDLHNGGCAALPHCLDVARHLLTSNAGRTALIAIAQNMAGQFFDQPEIRTKAQAAIPGDGAAVALVAHSGQSPILATECRTYGQYAGEMVVSAQPGRKYWQAGLGDLYVDFTQSQISQVVARGNRQVPEVAKAVCDRIGIHAKDVGLFVTNQPNRRFLSNWRETLEIPRECHRDTFDECGNLFGAGIPVNLDHAITDNQVRSGDIILMAGFAHAGDFAGAALIQWGGRD